MKAPNNGFFSIFRMVAIDRNMNAVALYTSINSEITFSGAALEATKRESYFEPDLIRVFTNGATMLQVVKDGGKLKITM